MSLSTAEVLEALDRRYGAKRGREQWVTIREARAGAGFDGNRGQCDYLAINTWQSKGLQLIGHEVKVSLSDWKRELERPEKSELFARHCRRWWVVAPSELASKIKPELPPKWGLMSVSDKGRITETVQAPSKEPVEVPVWWWIGWLAHIDRLEKRATESEIQRRVNEEVTKARDQWVRSRSAQESNRNEKLEDAAQRFKDATGTDLMHTWPHDFARLGELWRLARSGSDLQGAANRIRAVADLLDELSEAS